MKFHTGNIILASASPRRLQILKEHELSAIAIPSHIAEIKKEGETAREYVTRLAREKAQFVLDQVDLTGANLIIAADTTVAYQDHILEKPIDYQDAYRMLALLSGRSHDVLTGYALVFLPEQRWYTDCVITSIVFNTLFENQINNYIATGDPFDKAGAYGIQNVYDTFVKEIQGSYYNVMGLPIEDILEKLAL